MLFFLNAYLQQKNRLAAMKKLILLTAIALIGFNPTYAQSPVNSLDFDGGNDYVSMTLPTIFNDIANNDFTIEAWIKPNASVFSRVVFAQLNTSNFASISLSGTNQIYFYVNNVSGEATTTTLTTGVWSHVACTWDASTSTSQTYINGVLETTTAGGSSSLGIDNLMSIGAKTNASQFFTGELDEIRIWDVIRTPCQITTAMNSEFNVTQPNLVTYYNFNQGTAGGTNTGVVTLPDFTTNYDGTLINFALSGANSNWLSSGAAISALNQNSSFQSTDTQTACDTFTWVDGNTYSASNSTATYTFTTMSGCDSIVTLDLTINMVDSTVTQTGATLMANQSGATYQWLNCPAMTAISGATNQSFTATSNGDYALALNNNGCLDTSICFTVSGIGAGIVQDELGNKLTIYPNPAIESIQVNFDSENQVELSLIDLAGKVAFNYPQFESGQVINISDLNSGIYILQVKSTDHIYSQKFIKE